MDSTRTSSTARHQINVFDENESIQFPRGPLEHSLCRFVTKKKQNKRKRHEEASKQAMFKIFSMKELVFKS